MKIVSGTDPISWDEFKDMWRELLNSRERATVDAASRMKPHEYVDIGSVTPRCQECHRHDGKHNSRCPHRTGGV